MTWSTTGIHIDSTDRRDCTDRMVAQGAAAAEDEEETAAVAPGVAALEAVVLEVAVPEEEAQAVVEMGRAGSPRRKGLQAAQSRPGLRLVMPAAMGAVGVWNQPAALLTVQPRL
jgi:hypothetical protein